MSVYVCRYQSLSGSSNSVCIFYPFIIPDLAVLFSDERLHLSLSVMRAYYLLKKPDKTSGSLRHCQNTAVLCSIETSGRAPTKTVSS